MSRLLRIKIVTSLVLILILAGRAWGVSCTTQSQMTAAQRSALEQTAKALAASVQTGNATAVKEQTIAAVAGQFGGIAGSIEAVQPSLQHATIHVATLYLLNATDLKSAEEAQFFCGLAGSQLTVELTIPNLPPGQYALAILEASGVEHPQQLSMVLANDPPNSATWKLAGFFTRPMTMGGHDGVWFWRQARGYAAKKQLWDAWFYYQTAQFLLSPVDFLASPNLEKLQREAEQARPENLPGADPLRLSSGAQSFDITALRTGELAGQLDLVVTYKATGSQDPVAARAQVVAVMRAMLQQHPELAQAFHGLWVHASTPDNQHPFALELPMGEIEKAGSLSGQQSRMTTYEEKQAG